MNDCEHFHLLMSGYLDGELTSSERDALDRHIAGCEACRIEFTQLERLVSASAGLSFRSPPDEVWDTFLDGVYNRAERRAGWAILIAGAAALTAYGVYQFIVEPWGSALVKVLIAAPVAGLAVLFVSVLRQRLAAAKTDRYSREVMR